MKKIKNIAISFIFLIGIVVAYFQTDFENFSMKIESAQGEEAYTVDTIPPYSGKSYVTLNDNLPQFSEDEISAASYEKYSDLDSLKRCGVALANIGKDLMPTEVFIQSLSFDWLSVDRRKCQCKKLNHLYSLYEYRGNASL